MSGFVVTIRCATCGEEKEVWCHGWVWDLANVEHDCPRAPSHVAQSSRQEGIRVTFSPERRIF